MSVFGEFALPIYIYIRYRSEASPISYFATIFLRFSKKFSKKKQIIVGR